MTPDDYECRACGASMFVPDGMDPAEEDVRYCESCAIAEIERLRKDETRMKFLAGCASNDGPIIEGFANVLDDYWSFLGDVIRRRIGEENDDPDVEGTDEDKLEAFRSLVDASMAEERKIEG